MSEPKERPILFKGPLIRAILDDRKDVTRRLPGLKEINKRPGDYISDGQNESGDWLFRDAQGCTVIVKCPYGKDGDRLWCRETWRAVERKSDSVDGILFAADEAFIPIENTQAAADRWVEAYDNGKHGKRWRPSIFLPRWASRLDLDIASIRPERLQDITEDDARREGVDSDPGMPAATTHRTSFAFGWDKINGKSGLTWKRNPWTWRIEFRRRAI